MKMSNTVYDVLKWVVMIVLPAASLFYSGLAETWGLPYAVQIPDTLNLIAVFLGSAMMLSSHQYKKTTTQQ